MDIKRAAVTRTESSNVQYFVTSNQLTTFSFVETAAMPFSIPLIAKAELIMI